MIDANQLLLVSMLILSSSLWAGGNTLDYLTTFEQEVLAELNHARANPDRYAEYLDNLRGNYHGRELHRPGEPILITEEGLPALEEAIEFLKTVQPRDKLTPSRGLSLSAGDHVNDQSRSRVLGHGGSDGSVPWERMNRYGTWQYTAAENISYGNNDPRGVLIQLIIDDGTPSRGHRTNIFNPDYQFVGIACGPHNLFGLMCVMDFAGDYVETNK